MNRVTVALVALAAMLLIAVPAHASAVRTEARPHEASAAPVTPVWPHEDRRAAGPEASVTEEDDGRVPTRGEPRPWVFWIAALLFTAAIVVLYRRRR